MNHVFAHSLAVEMVARTRFADDFFESVSIFDSIEKDSPKEYEFALKTAIHEKLIMEDDEWRLKALAFLDEKGIA